MFWSQAFRAKNERMSLFGGAAEAAAGAAGLVAAFVFVFVFPSCALVLGVTCAAVGAGADLLPAPGKAWKVNLSHSLTPLLSH